MDALLEPIVEHPPCGVDLSFDPIYNELARLIEGPPEGIIAAVGDKEGAAAKEPPWRDIRDKAEDALRRSMDLQIAVYHAVALLKLNGLEGAARGLEILSGMIRQYWNELYPALDPDDPDCVLRVNVLQQLSAPLGGYQDPIRFVERLQEAPLLASAKLGVVTLGSVNQNVAEAGRAISEMTSLAEAEKALNAANLLKRLAAAAHGIDDFLVATLGGVNSPDLGLLIKTIDQGLRAFERRESVGAASSLTNGGGTAAPAASGGAAAASAGVQPALVFQSIAGSSAVQSAADVKRLLDAICEFYAKTEPSSPVPQLLRRAKRLIGKNFLDLLEDLAPGGKDDFIRAAGLDNTTGS